MSIAPAVYTLRRALTSVELRRNVSVLLGAASLGGTTVSLCEDKSFVDKLMESTKAGDYQSVMDSVATQLGDQIQGAVDSGIPTQLSYGFVSGYCSGLALKKAGRAAAVVFGTYLSGLLLDQSRDARMRDVYREEQSLTLTYLSLTGAGFAIMQTLQYSGYIEVDHGKLRKDVESMFDLDKDGDVDKDDANMAYAKVLSVLQYNMPAGGGFGAGFLGGLRSG